jgi:hypothetical protein
MGKHYQSCTCSMFPDGHLVLKADRMKHHLELEQVEFWPPRAKPFTDNPCNRSRRGAIIFQLVFLP